MEYGYAGASQAQQPECDEIKPLESLSNIADEAERTITLIEAFITRFRHGALAGENKTGLTPVPSGHAGQLTRLRDAVDQLNKLAREIGTIG